MKAYSDLPQSIELAKYLSSESADMYYFRQIDNDYIPPDVLSIHPTPLFIDGKENFNYDIPCWSLAALLALIPRPDLHCTRDNRWCCIAEPNSMVFSNHFDNPIDACVDMILKLNEMNSI